MSEGPIKQWRDSFKRPTVTTPQSTAVHAPGARAGVAYCGRKISAGARWPLVSCSDCLAARRADLLAAQ